MTNCGDRWAGCCETLHELNRLRHHSKPIRIHDSTRKRKRVIVFAFGRLQLHVDRNFIAPLFMIPSLHFAFYRRDNLRGCTCVIKGPPRSEQFRLFESIGDKNRDSFSARLLFVISFILYECVILG